MTNFFGIGDDPTIRKQSPVWENKPKEKLPKRKEPIDFKFEEYDVNEDGILTGDEVKRTKSAGYIGISEGMNKENAQAFVGKNLDYGTVAFGISRTVAQNTDSKLAYGLALFADTLLMPFELPISILQRL